MESHLADCDYCLGLVGFLARTGGVEASEVVPNALLARAKDLANTRRSSLRWTQWQWQTAAAAIVVAVAAGVLWVEHPARRFPSAPTPPTRSEAESKDETPPALRTSQSAVTPAVVFPAPDSALSRREVEFRWEKVSGAASYEVQVMTEAGNRVWEYKTRANSARPSPEAKLLAGQKYFVWVRAQLLEGKTVRSKAVPFRIKQ